MKTIDLLSSLTDVPSDVLSARLYEMRKKERASLVAFLAHLAELDRRKVVIGLGYPSLFAYCTDYLGLTKSGAFRRTTAARILARFPIVAEYLADGRLCLTTLVDLRDVLEQEGLVSILDRAAGRTEDQVKELVAALRPRAAMPDLFRRLPVAEVSSGPEPTLPAEVSSGPEPTLPAEVSSGPEPTVPAEVSSGPEPTVPATRARLEPIAPQLHILRVTVGPDFAADLEAVRQALSHKFPDRRLEDVLHECLRVTLDKCQRRRRGVGKMATAKAPPKGSRYVPAAWRDEVWRRDGSQCTFVGVTGHRCASKYRLELHHIVPFAMGGPSTVANLTLRCQAHNLYAAELDYPAHA